MRAHVETKPIPMLTVFVLTAIATGIAQRLPPERDLVPLALLLDLVPVGSVAVATALAIRSLRRASLSLVRLLIGAYGYFAGGLVGALGVAHTVAVTMLSVERARQHEFVYSYRFYSLVLLGVLLIVTGLIAAVQAERLARGRRSGRRASVSVWAAILAINLPLVPLQGFAILFSVLAAVELLLLARSRDNPQHDLHTRSNDSRDPSAISARSSNDPLRSPAATL